MQQSSPVLAYYLEIEESILKDEKQYQTNSQEDLSHIEMTHNVISFLSSKYYDLGRLKQDIITDLQDSSLKDLEFEQGRYESSVDFLGTLETTARNFGLNEVGIEETATGYKLGEQEASSIEELDQAESSIMDFANILATELTEKLDLPGVLYFGISSDWGDKVIRLFYAFEDSDLPTLQSLGIEIEGMPSLVGFDEIMASLESEGCHDIAIRLHSILREN